MKEFVYRKLANYFLERRGRDAIPIGAPDCYRNNDFFVHLADENYGEHNYILESLNDDSVTFRRWDRDGQTHVEDTFPIHVLWSGEISVLHHISRFTREYRGLLSAFLIISSGYYRLKIWQSRQTERTIRLRKNRIELLKDLVTQNTQNPGMRFTAEDAMIHIYGRRVMEVERTLPYWNYSRFVIRSLAVSGDLIPADNVPIETASTFALSPSSLATLENYDLEERRHRRALSISRGQLLIAFMLLIVAALTLLSRIGYLEEKIGKAKSVDLAPVNAPRWQPDTSWHTEPVTEEAVSFRGSFQNALDTLRVRSQAWKLIALHGNDQCEWGLKVVIEFPDHPDYRAAPFGGVSFMPVTKIEYQLFDKEGFHLTTLVMDEGDMGVAEKESYTFQSSGMVPINHARRAAYGRLNIQAGYAPKKE